MSDLEIRTSQLGRSFQVGDIVFTDAEEFRDQWWWGWPGVVRECSELEDHCIVEFMGFAQMVTRRRKVNKRQLKLLDEDGVHARIDRVLRYIRLPSDEHP